MKGVAITASNSASRLRDVVGDMEVLLLVVQEIRDDNQRIYGEHRRSSAFVIDVRNALLDLLREELRKPCANQVSISPDHRGLFLFDVVPFS